MIEKSRPDEFDRLRKRCERYGLRLTKFRRGYRVWGARSDGKPSVMLDAAGVGIILKGRRMLEELADAQKLEARSRVLFDQAKAVNRAHTFGQIDGDTYSALWADLDQGFERVDREWDRLDGALR